MKTPLIQVAGVQHLDYAESICRLIEEAAKIRGTGIAKRNPEYIRQKIKEEKAIIALADGRLAGFCYIETWDHAKYVAHSGLIVNPDFRGLGLAKKIKAEAMNLSRKRFPEAKVFGLTTSLPVMKINSELGYKPVTFSELTQDETFWKGCQSCVNYDVLTRTKRKHCLCTGMLYDPKNAKNQKSTWKYPLKVYERWLKFKRYIFFQDRKKVKES
ncbi:MAG: GNAT family N-acetyltransferase [Bacteroidota bacterium]